MKFPGKVILNRLIFSFLVLFCTQQGSLWSQSEEHTKILLNWYDSGEGVSGTGLINGLEVVEDYRAFEDTHKYFLSPYFSNGNLNYLGQEYFDVPLLYDIHENKLLIQLNEKSRSSIFQLLSGGIDSFEIHGANFFKLEIDGEIGFYEIISSNENFKLYRRHKKFGSRKIGKGDKLVLYEFKLSKPAFILEIEGEFHIVMTKNDLYQIFPNEKLDIKKLFRNTEVKRAWKQGDMAYVFDRLIMQLGTK